MTDRTPIPQARDLMTTRVDTIDPEADIVSAVQSLLRHGHSGAPVVDADKRLLGVLSEHDCIRVLSQAIASGWPQGRTSDHMSKDVATVTESEDVLSLASRFSNGPHRRLFVVEGDRLVGVITRSDLLRALAALEQQAEGGRKISTLEIIEGRHRDLR